MILKVNPSEVRGWQSIRMGLLRNGLDIWRASHANATTIRRMQAQRAARLFQYAKRYSPYYKDVLPPDMSIEHLPDIPKQTKATLMQHFDDWVTDRAVRMTDLQQFVLNLDNVGKPFHGRYLVNSTSGTTGQPGIFLQDASCMQVYSLLTVMRSLPMIFGRAGTWKFLAQRPRATLLACDGGHFSGYASYKWRQQRLMGARHSFVSVMTPPNEQVAHLNTFHPDVLSGYPSALYEMACQQAAGYLHIQPRVIYLAGETISAQHRAFMGKVFKCPVRDLYAATEFLGMAYECRYGWLHLNSDWVIMEPIQRDGRPTPLDQYSHSVLLTNLANFVQPFIRYELGDAVLIRSQRCECGSHFPAMRIQGRSGQILLLPHRSGSGEVRILPLALATVIEETHGVLGFQLQQKSPQLMHFLLVIEPDASRSEVWAHLQQRLTSYFTELDAKIPEMVLREEDPARNARGGKWQQFKVEY